MKRLFRDLRVVIIAVVASSLLAAAPAMAAYDAINADTVDGRHAVGAGAKVKQRAGKLIAANKAGFLPRNAIKQVKDSARLGGKTRAGFVQRTSDIGRLQTGVWAVSGPGTGRGSGAVRFLESLRSKIGADSVIFVDPGQQTVECPGPGEVVAQGFLCFYVTDQANMVALNARNPLSGTYGASRNGVVVMGRFSDNGYAYGTWAVRSAE